LRAVNTNVLVRLLVNDDPAEADAAQQAMAAAPVFVPKTVLLEMEWVLRSAYKRSPAAIAVGIEGLLAAAGISVEDAAPVRRAVAWFREGLDFTDALHLASSGHVDAFVTFDATMRRRAAALGVSPPVSTP
jgi:predicted nucleic-acid-binding protein